MESPALPGSQRPDTTNLPGLTFGPFGYEPTAAVEHAGADSTSNRCSSSGPTRTFETSRSRARRARFMRVQLNGRIHPMGEVVFHPTARRGDPEWRVMYIGIGDGGSGESRTVDSPESAAARHAGRQDSPHHSRSGEHVGDEHAERKRPLPHPERQPVRRRSRAHERKSGRTAFAIRIG